MRAEEIPLGARIIFVTDAYDAMTSDRIYRPKRSSEAALAELERCAGTQFDPGIVAAFAEELHVSFPAEAAAPALAS
jgi:HD-GYP domain-containing protein (c-di-GMP phosphodiesterase class II)